MNVRILTILVFVVIILGGLGFFFMNEQNTKQLAEKITQTSPAEETDPQSTGLITVRSNDNRVSFKYPEKWILTETTARSVQGKFGPIFQSWTIRNIPGEPSAQNVLAENTVNLTITIQSGGSNMSIDSLVDCSLKTIVCDKIGIDSQQFITSDTMLNTGMEIITVGTFYDDKILTGEAQIAPGSDKTKLKAQANLVLRSFTFSGNSPVND